METNSLLLYGAGLFDICVVVFHLFFARIFNWGNELGKVSFVNRNIMKVMNLCLILIFIWFAVILFIFNIELLKSSLGLVILGGMALFWLARTIEQFILFGIHPKSNIFSAIWALGTLLHGLPLLLNHT